MGARRPRPAVPVVLNDEERETLERWSPRPPTHVHPQRLARVVDTEHLHITKSHQQFIDACSITLHRDPPVLGCVTTPILEDPSTSDADTHRPHPDLIREEPSNLARETNERLPEPGGALVGQYVAGIFSALDEEDRHIVSTAILNPSLG